MARQKLKFSKTKVVTMFRLGYKMAFETKGKKKNWDDIFSLWYCAAINGHIRAQFYLGTCYDHGYGTEKNLQLAFNWYLKAAKAGHRDSQYNIAFFYNSGELGRKNPKKKIYWYELAAKSGLSDAQRDLGYAYLLWRRC
jgi:TPR repeat protein